MDENEINKDKKTILIVDDEKPIVIYKRKDTTH